MSRTILTLGFLLLIPLSAWCQVQEEDVKVLDEKYREDQFYFGVTYNLLRQMPSDMAQNGFSGGFHFGFIRDMPINKKRNLSVGIGLGYSANSVNQNLLISEDTQGDLQYNLLENGSFSKNKFSQHLIELPLEFRWRNSTPESYKFFRVYAGFKVGYVFASSSKFKSSDATDFKLRGLGDFNAFQYGFSLAVGYDKFNAYVYYALNSIFKNDAKLVNETLDISMVKIGLILYIL